MGITRRLLNLARSNLNALIAPKGNRGAGSPKGDEDEVPLDGFSDAELEAELEQRRRRRRRQDEARVAREQAERAARERARTTANVTAAASRAAAPARASSTSGSTNGAGAANRKPGAAPTTPRPPRPTGSATAARAPGASSTRTTGSTAPAGGARSTSSGGASANPRRPSVPINPDRLRRASLYAQLETPDGAAMDVVKSNFRRLMRQHHPDMNGGSPEKLKAATERTMKLTAAYDELERLLTPTSR